MKKLLLLLLLIGVFFGQDTLEISLKQRMSFPSSDTANYRGSLLIDGDELYLFWQDDIIILDITDNDTIIYDTCYTVTGNAFIDGFISDSLLLVNSADTLYIFDKEPASLELYSKIDKPYSKLMLQYDDTLAVFPNSYSVFSINFNDPEIPDTLDNNYYGRSDAKTPKITGVVKDSILFSLDYNSPYIDICKLNHYPDSIPHISKYFLGPRIRDIGILYDTLMVSTRMGIDLQVDNIVNIDSIYTVFAQNDSTIVRSINICDTLCYCTLINGIDIRNVTNPDTLYTIGRYFSDDFVKDLVVDDHNVYYIYCNDTDCDSLILKQLTITP